MAVVLEASTLHGYFFKLCQPCHHRLINIALRPAEFFNLATIHGIDNPWLHDDFYEWETGAADQPRIEVEEADKFPFPSFESVKGNYKKAVDLACVQFDLEDELVGLLQHIDKASVLECLEYKVSYNRAISHYAYRVAARVLGRYAAGWMRRQWTMYQPGDLWVFAEGVAACLPFEEAFELLTGALQERSDMDMANEAGILSYFQHPTSLGWIESVKHRIVNVSSGWGMVAAASRFDWVTARRWLTAGRPLSLIALDALVYCTARDSKTGQSLWLRNHPPILHQSPGAEEIAEALTAYLQTDSVHRTRGTVATILENLEQDLTNQR